MSSSGRTPAGKPVLSSLHADDDAHWNAVVDVIRVSDHPALLPWLRAFLRMSRGRAAVIVRGTVSFRERYRDLLGASLLRLRAGRRRPIVVISDATIEPGSRALAGRVPPLVARLLSPASRLLVRLVDGPHVRWCVLSTEELRSFPATWKVDPSRVVFTPFQHTLWHDGENEPVTDDGFVFAGGNSLRDYPLLIDAVRDLPVPVRIATSWRPDSPPPPHVEIGTVPHEEFLALLRSCAVVVVPLVESVRSTGQQTYLNAMVLGKPVIVTQAPGVRDHIDDGVTGVIVPRDAAVLRAAIADALDPANSDRYAEMGARARADVLARFTERHYRARLLAVAGLPAGKD
jgi:hypothetical protein